jgi:hypothetical protein
MRTSAVPGLRASSAHRPRDENSQGFRPVLRVFWLLSAWEVGHRTRWGAAMRLAMRRDARALAPGVGVPSRLLAEIKAQGGLA